MNSSCLVAAAWCLAATGASAQVVYRFGSEYTRVACADGKRVDVSEPVASETRPKAKKKSVETSVDGDFIARVPKTEPAAS